MSICCYASSYATPHSLSLLADRRKRVITKGVLLIVVPIVQEGLLDSLELLSISAEVLGHGGSSTGACALLAALLGHGGSATAFLATLLLLRIVRLRHGISAGTLLAALLLLLRLVRLRHATILLVVAAATAAVGLLIGGLLHELLRNLGHGRRDDSCAFLVAVVFVATIVTLAIFVMVRRLLRLQRLQLLWVLVHSAMVTLVLLVVGAILVMLGRGLGQVAVVVVAVLAVLVMRLKERQGSLMSSSVFVVMLAILVMWL